MGLIFVFGLLLSQSFHILQANGSYLLHQAYTLEAYGHYRKAAAVRMALAKLLLQPPDPDAMYNLILAGADYYEGGDHCPAIRLWRRVLRHVDQPVFDGDIFAERGDYARAFKRYAVLFAGNSVSANGIFLQNGSVQQLHDALVVGSTGKFSSAKDQLQKIINNVPVFPFALLAYGDVQDATHRREDAVSTWVTVMRTYEIVPAGSPPELGSSEAAMEMVLSRGRNKCAS